MTRQDFHVIIQKVKGSPETEPTHFNALLKPYLAKYNDIDQLDFIEKYNSGKLKNLN